MRRLLVVLLALAGPARALEIEGGVTHESLDKGLPDWDSVYLEAAHDLAPRQTVYGVLRETDRFDLRDTELAVGYYHPFSPSWGGQIEVAASPDHHVLPRSSIFGQLSWIAGDGWIVNGGARLNEYTENNTRVLNGSVEKYFGAWRAAYALYNGKPEGAGSATAHRVVLDYYYGERSRVGIGATWGREVENVGPPTGLITSDVRAIGIYGRHWFTPAWAVTWDLGTHEQGELYTRTGGRLGLRYRF